MSKQVLNNRENALLALHGGRPAVRREPPPWPFYDEKDRQALSEVLESRVWGGYHESVGELERRFASYHGASYAIATVNGTVSLEIALAAAGVRPGDEVIVPPITFVASASAVARVGAVPVFTDVNHETINLDPEKAEQVISERTRAIMLVHFAGCPADLDSFTGICRKHNLVLIEDCAHAHGAEWRGRRVGSFGDFGSFSFQASKNMTAGEGGILITSNAEMAERARAVTNQGRRIGGQWYEHVTLGTNARLTGFQAALLLNQLERLPEQVKVRMERADALREGLMNIKGFRPTPETLDEPVTAHGLHLFSMRIDENALGRVPRARIIEALKAEGVPVTAGYPYPIYHNQLFKEHPHVTNPCPEAENYCREAIWLPHNALLADADWINDVLLAFRKVSQSAHKLLAEGG